MIKYLQVPRGQGNLYLQKPNPGYKLGVEASWANKS